MPESLYHKLSMLAAKTGRKKVDQRADVVGEWVKEDGRVKAIFLARIKLEENFSRTSESCSGLAA